MGAISKTIDKNKFGQYFTPKVIAEFMMNLTEINPQTSVLEPSCGEGVFLDLLLEKNCTNLTAYEIDKNLAQNYPFVKHQSFVSAKITQKFDLVIGNPPYIRWKNLEETLKLELAQNRLWNTFFNSLCDYLYIFILKSIEHLKENGILIFICPEYWLSTTHAQSLRNYMVQHGFFEEIYHFIETPIFENVTTSTIVFKYVKSTQKIEKIKVAKYYSNKKLDKNILNQLKNGEKLTDVEYLRIPQFQTNQVWFMYDEKTKNNLSKLKIACRKTQSLSFLHQLENKIDYYTIGEICDIGNGLVSGLDKAFQLNGHQLNQDEKNALIDVVKAKDLEPYITKQITKYIFIEKPITESQFKQIYPNFYEHFQNYKENLENRYQYNRSINYWNWVFLRNLKLFKKPVKRIFVPCKERISNKNYFRFAFANENEYPTQDVTAIFKKNNTKESLEYILAFLNHPIIYHWLKTNGIVKGNIVEFSEKPISNIPFRRIDWSNPNEVYLHNKITSNTQQYIASPDNKFVLTEIENLFTELLQLQ